jgi:hypothetical protein
MFLTHQLIRKNAIHTRDDSVSEGKPSLLAHAVIRPEAVVNQVIQGSRMYIKVN